MRPPPSPKMRRAMDVIDEHERAKGSCDRCGKPIQGVLRFDYHLGRLQTRAEAGLCNCEPEPAA